MKGIYNGFKFISQIFVVKEREMEIGYPTDVKHVAHIGWDGPSAADNAPSWMNEFKTPPDFSATSLGNTVESKESTWSSQEEESIGRGSGSSADHDFEQSMGRRPGLDIFQDNTTNEVSKKYKWKKTKSSSSPKSSSSSRSSRAGKSKTNFMGMAIKA